MLKTAYTEGAAAASVAFGVKQADSSFSVGLPGLGFSTSSRDERLPGMSRWAPREYIEQAYDALDRGTNPSVLVEQAAREGGALHPAIGAALGGLAGYKLYPKSGMGAPSLGALLGATAGSMYNNLTAGDRARRMSEAIRGVYHENTPLPTAQAPVTKVVSGASEA